MVATMTSLPAVFRGLLGEPIAIDTLGGFMSWRVGNFLPVLLGLWSVIALSGTLAGEAASGSLDIVASTGHSRRSIAIQKVAGHVVAVAAAMAIVARPDHRRGTGVRGPARRRDRARRPRSGRSSCTDC